MKINFSSSTIVKNFLSVSLVQATNYLIPLITFPYLVKELGIEKFGLISFAQACAIQLSVVTDYSFNLSATREIAIAKTDFHTLKKIYSKVVWSKIFLLIVTVLIMITCLLIFPVFNREITLFMVSFSIVIGQTINPIWFFQGIEQMKYITMVNLVAKVFFAAMIFIFVKSYKDYLLPNIFQGIGIIISGLISHYIIISKFKIYLSIPNIKEIIKEYIDGWPIFISNFAISIYISSNIIILGITTNDKIIVGYYGIAEKIINAVRQLLVVFSQVIYPHVCRLANNSLNDLKSFFRKMLWPFICVIFVLCGLLLIFSDIITKLISGDKYNPMIVHLIKILSFVPFIVSLNIQSYQTLLAYNRSKDYGRILTTGSILNIILTFVLSYYFKAFGAAVSVLITEIIITTSLYLTLTFRKINYNANLR